MPGVNKKFWIPALSLSALAISIPAISQDSPESLLPPGFGNPPTAPAPPPPPLPPPPPSSTPSVQPSAPSAPSSSSSGGEQSAPSRPRRSPSSGSSGIGNDDDDLLVEDEPARYDVPPAARRSLARIGVITQKNGGFPVDAFGDTDGEILAQIITGTQGPLLSRWANIITRRLLASRTNSPDGIKPQTWVAERAWLLLRMGESVTARQLVQQVDAGNYNKRLYTVGMQAMLANADLSGMCPLANRARIVDEDAQTWKMAQPICASLAAEQANATAFLRRNSRNRTMVGVDYLLAEKAVGAGIDGRRQVKVEWDGVKDMNGWRFGLSHATGIEPPARLYERVGRHVDGWRAQLPMLPVETRVAASFNAAALGVISNRALVDLYAQALEDPDASSAVKDRAEDLALAFSAGSPSERVNAMTQLWGSANGARQEHAMLVLTARAAAAVPASGDLSENSDNLIRSMMTAGFDKSAASWIDVASEGSLGWGLLMVGSPGMEGEISYGQLDSFYDEDDSDGYIKSKMLLAGVAGLGRTNADIMAEFSEELEISLTRESNWTRAITAAAARGESGTVVLLTAAALQGKSWAKVEPRLLYHIVRALKQVGREAEARMIAAEAVSFA